jgi:hypothetical protein
MPAHLLAQGGGDVLAQLAVELAAATPVGGDLDDSDASW